MPKPDNTCFQHVLSGVQTESEKNTKQVKKILFYHVLKSATSLLQIWVAIVIKVLSKV